MNAIHVLYALSTWLKHVRTIHILCFENIVFDDAELIWFLKEIERLGWKVGVDIGVVSYDETPMKELLHGGISVLTTDFQAMGSIAVSMIKGELSGRMANRFELISRGSF